MAGPVYNPGELKGEAEKASIMKSKESPIQAQIARIQNELEYLALDIGALSEKTHIAQGRPPEDAEAGSRDTDESYDSRSPLQQQLYGINQTISIHRAQIRRLIEIIEL